jgi:hypothetical protein
MRDSEEIQDLEAKIARDEQRYREIERLENDLTHNIPRQGFQAASTAGRYRTEKQALDEALFYSRQRLASARNQPD